MGSVNYYAKPELREKRKEMKITQKEMMSLINATLNKTYDRSLFTYIENQQRSVDPQMAVAISRILKVEIEDIFTNEQSEDTE